MTVLRKVTGTFAIGLCGLGAIAGAAGASTAKASSETITLYNGQHEQTTSALIKGFKAATGITVLERDNDEDAMASQIVEEGSKSPADVIFTENSPVLEFLQEKGLLAKVASSTLAKVPAKYNSPKGDWVGASARVSVIVYNTKLISAASLPKTVMAVADTKYKGKVGIAPSETDFQPVVTSIVRAHGPAAALKWLGAVKANAGAASYEDNETLVAKVNSGAVAFGIINQYYWYRLGAELGAGKIHSKIAYFAPRDPGYIIDVSGAGVLASSKHQAAAQKFVAYIVSKAGQEIIAKSDSYEYPIGSGVVTAQPETPLGKLTPAPLTVADLGDGQVAIGLLAKAGLT